MARGLLGQKNDIQVLKLLAGSTAYDRNRLIFLNYDYKTDSCVTWWELVLMKIQMYITRSNKWLDSTKTIHGIARGWFSYYDRYFVTYNLLYLIDIYIKVSSPIFALITVDRWIRKAK